MPENPAPVAAANPVPAPPAQPSWPQKLHSATWWVTVAGAATVLADAIFGWKLDSRLVETFAGMVATLFAGSAYVTAHKG